MKHDVLLNEHYDTNLHCHIFMNTLSNWVLILKVIQSNNLTIANAILLPNWCLLKTDFTVHIFENINIEETKRSTGQKILTSKAFVNQGVFEGF